jgi:hypothetical protein
VLQQRILALRRYQLVGQACSEKDRYRHSNRTHFYDSAQAIRDLWIFQAVCQGQAVAANDLCKLRVASLPGGLQQWLPLQ